jgi:hypothetical protein
MRVMLTVAAVLKETLQTTLQFVSWYLAQGADEIILCFDDPQDPAIEVLKGIDRVRCVPCTPKFWASVGMTMTRRFTRRQNRAIQSFYYAQTDGWFLHVDGDELVYLKGRTLAEELAHVHDDVRGLRILPAENIQTVEAEGATHFRLPMSRRAVRRIYSERPGAMQKRQGLSGHLEGKAVTRAGLEGVKMRQHSVHLAGGEPVVDLTLGPEDDAYLLHFFDQGYEIWRSKLEWRLSSSGYRGLVDAALREMLAGPTPETALRAFYDHMHLFDDTRLHQLKKNGAHFSLDLNRNALVQRYFPDLSDLSDRPASYAA